MVAFRMVLHVQQELKHGYVPFLADEVQDVRVVVLLSILAIDALIVHRLVLQLAVIPTQHVVCYFAELGHFLLPLYLLCKLLLDAVDYRRVVLLFVHYEGVYVECQTVSPTRVLLLAIFARNRTGVAAETNAASHCL